MKVRSWLLAIACMAAAGSGAATASAATTTFDVPITGTVVSDCTGDTVLVTGTMHVKQTSNSSVDGAKSQLETNLTGAKGTTATGARYVMNDQVSDMQHAEFDPFGNAQLTMENTTILTRLGELGALVTGDDLRLHVLAHLTVTNGVTRAQKFDLRTDCV
jgi:hypothetical protein